MVELHWRLTALITTLDDDSQIARSLLLPGVSCYASNGKRLREMLCRQVADVMKRIPRGEIYRYLPPESAEVRSMSLTVPPLRDDLLRRHDADLTLQYVLWRHGDEAVVAYLPVLDMEVLADDEQQLAELLPTQALMALSRTHRSGSLRELSALERYRELRVRPLRLKLKMPTLKEEAIRQVHAAAKDKSILKEIASNLATVSAAPVYERDTEVSRLAELLTRRNPSSVLLVGSSGVGKTALVQHLARNAVRFGLGATSVWSTSGSRIVAGMTGFGMWQERCEQIAREAHETKALLHLGNLVELIEVGKGGCNMQGVAGVLRPHLDRRDFLAIAECTPEQLAVVEREDPQLLETFVLFEVEPPSPDQTRAILQSVALEPAAGAHLPPESLHVLDRLHRRWATYSAAPGRQLRFLRNLLADRSRRDGRHKRHGGETGTDARREITACEVTAAFSHETGLPLFMLDDTLPLDLPTTRAWFRQRVLGQSEAVLQVVDLLAAVKTGLARGGKPIASLLFIGPTGVGKTEMAKALAEFLFQDSDRMVRFDMSEYSHPGAVERLIGGAYSAQGLLTQKVRDQPFTVVLLDEFEKAHPQFFDVLLQVLGEGRLTDGIGRVTDFTNAVVIMTSNLGAESYRRTAFGFSGESAADELAGRHFEREVRAFLRPEMFNRLDRILAFAPLDRTTISAIAKRELDQVLARDGLRFRGVDLTAEADVVDWLAQIGFDPRYGARPLKRAIERELVAPVATKINQYSTELLLGGRVKRGDDRLLVDVVARPKSDGNTSAANAIQLVIGLRRHVQAMQHSGTLTRLRNEIERIRLEQRTRERRLKKRGQPIRYSFTPDQARLLSQEELLKRVEELARQVAVLEDGCLSRFYSSEPIDPGMIHRQWSGLDEEFRELLFDLPRVEGDRKGRLTIAAFGESMPTVVELLKIYRDVCRRNNGPVLWFWLKMYRPEYDETLGTPARPVRAPPEYRPTARLLSRTEREEETPEKVIDVFNATDDSFDAPPQDCIGIAMQLSEDRSVALLQTESGRHEFLSAGGTRDVCLIETVMDRLLNYDPPGDIGRRGSLSQLPLRRVYDWQEEVVRDERLDKSYPIRARQLDEPVNAALQDYLQARLWELLETWS